MSSVPEQPELDDETRSALATLEAIEARAWVSIFKPLLPDVLFRETLRDDKTYARLRPVFLKLWLRVGKPEPSVIAELQTILTELAHRIDERRKRRRRRPKPGQAAAEGER